MSQKALLAIAIIATLATTAIAESRYGPPDDGASLAAMSANVDISATNPILTTGAIDGVSAQITVAIPDDLVKSTATAETARWAIPLTGARAAATLTTSYGTIDTAIRTDATTTITKTWPTAKRLRDTGVQRAPAMAGKQASAITRATISYTVFGIKFGR